MNTISHTKKEPDYFYDRNMGHYNIYRRNPDGSGTKIDQHWDKEEARKRVYELNGWKYKPKTTK